MPTVRMALAGVLGLSGGLFVGGLFGYQLFDRELPVVMLEGKALNYLVKPGDTAQIQFHFYRRQSCYTRSDAEWKSSAGRRFPVPMRDWAAGLLPLGEDIAVLEVPVPLEASPGRLQYESTNSYGCNFISKWLWPVVASQRTVEFWVER